MRQPGRCHADMPPEKKTIPPSAKGLISRAVIAGPFVFVSHMGPYGKFDAGIVEQATAVLENVKKALEEAGSSMDKVVKATVFLKDINDYEAFNQVYAEFFANSPPARDCIQVAGLPPPGTNVRVGVTVIALL